MTSSPYSINDVLHITRNGETVLVRVAGFVDGLDDSKPLYVNLRCSGGKRWSEQRIKIVPEQITEPLPHWYEEQKAAWEAQLKRDADEIYAKLSPSRKERLHRDMEQRARRSPIEILIDRAVGRE